MNTLNTPRDVIYALGGVSQVARRLGLGRTAVQNWTFGESFPTKTRDAMKTLLAEVGADAPNSLWPMLLLPPKSDGMRRGKLPRSTPPAKHKPK